jgi:PAS domain S-box-containing protein
MITRLSDDGRILYVSPACKIILGYSPDELIGKKYQEFIHPEESGVMNELLEKGKPLNTYIVTFRSLKKNGEYVWLETSARAMIDQKGDVVEIQAASRDITERKNAEKALQDAHQNLQEAYERTIEGWVRALDLRDRETEGHTQRVTSLTIKAAKALGINEEDLVHIQRGALLHDMGKMAIPDEILQKPGPLNEDEWKKMRKHPEYAYDMLSPISYLHPALDIPLGWQRLSARVKRRRNSPGCPPVCNCRCLGCAEKRQTLPEKNAAQ